MICKSNFSFFKRKKNAGFPENRSFAISILLHTIFTALLVSCQSGVSDQDKSETQTDSVSRFTEKTEIKHAKGFNIDYYDHYKVVSIFSPFENSTDTTKYLLLQKGAKKPDGFKEIQTIEIPITSLVAMSSMHVGLLGMLDSYDVLSGLGNLQYVYSPEVIALIQTGKISEVGKDQGLNEEKLVTMKPDVVMTMGSPGAGIERYQTLSEANIPVLINSEWVETTPLARAEWVKLLAALLNKEQLANNKFDAVEKKYIEMKALAEKASRKPNIISGLNTKDTWFLPSGKSYMTQFFLDAGADYQWKNDRATGSLSLSFEAVYPTALKADYWMNVGFAASDTKKGILAQDSRYADFKAYKSGQMYSYNNRVNAVGSNDFFESGNINPHIVLADLIKIFHPELLPEHQLVYYKKLK